MSVPAAGSVPDASGHFGPYGGRFVPEALVAALDELTAAWASARTDEAFVAELDGRVMGWASVNRFNPRP